MDTAEALTGITDFALLRRAFAHVPSGVVALAAETNGVESVLVASSFTVGVSADPPLVSVAIQRTSTTWPRLRSARTIGISVFAEDQAARARQMASPRTEERLSDITLAEFGFTARFVDGASAWFEGVVYREVDAGDHHLVLLEVLSFRTDPERSPLVFHNSGFHSLTH